jgi:integrase
MSILKMKKPNCWLVRVRKLHEGITVSRRITVTGQRADALQAEIDLIKELATGKEERTRSLKIATFGEALTYYRENTDADLTRSLTYFNRLGRDLGAVPIRNIGERFGEYWRLIRNDRAERTGKPLAPATRNRLLMYSKAALNLCVKRGLISSNPLACFDTLDEQARDRVLTDEEADRILEVMKQRDSYLYWPFYFSLKNPIRRGDLCKLTSDNIDWFKPWVHFKPSKTWKRKKREACLPFIDQPLLEYFKTVPQGELLFARVDKGGKRHPLGDWKRHWGAILTEARVEGFVWHDLKHTSITWMLDNGYTDRDLKNLGIQYSFNMIDRYYQHDANKVLSKWKNGTMASSNGLQAEKVAKFI